MIFLVQTTETLQQNLNTINIDFFKLATAVSFQYSERLSMLNPGFFCIEIPATAASLVGLFLV
jgi:hypothetical protein